MLMTNFQFSRANSWRFVISSTRAKISYIVPHRETEREREKFPPLSLSLITNSAVLRVLRLNKLAVETFVQRCTASNEPISGAHTNRSISSARMLYVVAVGTLISTLNQAYKSSEVHVSTRMISGGRLLALTSSGIYRYTPLATTVLVRAHARAHAVGSISPSRRKRSLSRRGNTLVLARIRARLHRARYQRSERRLCAHHRLERLRVSS